MQWDQQPHSHHHPFCSHQITISRLKIEILAYLCILQEFQKYHQEFRNIWVKEQTRYIWLQPTTWCLKMYSIFWNKATDGYLAKGRWWHWRWIELNWPSTDRDAQFFIFRKSSHFAVHTMYYTPRKKFQDLEERRVRRPRRTRRWLPRQRLGGLTNMTTSQRQMIQRRNQVGVI